MVVIGRGYCHISNAACIISHLMVLPVLHTTYTVLPVLHATYTVLPVLHTRHLYSAACTTRHIYSAACTYNITSTDNHFDHMRQICVILQNI